MLMIEICNVGTMISGFLNAVILHVAYCFTPTNAMSLDHPPAPSLCIAHLKCVV